jgi:outer membrane protein assembly factor BamA
VPELAALTDAAVVRVDIRGAGSELPEVIEAVHTRAGTSLDRDVLRADLRRLWALGIASRIDATVTETPAGPEVELAVVAPPRIERFVGGGRLAELAMLRPLVGTFYDPSRIGRIAGVVERTLRARGHLRARVRTSASVACGRATVRIDAQDGPRYRLAALEVTGSKLPVGRLTFERNLGHVNVVGGVLRLGDLIVDLNRLLERHHRDGWLEAKADEPEVTYDDTHVRVSVRATIVAGPRYRLGRLPIGGGDPRARAIAEAALRPLRGAIYDGAAYDAVFDRLLEDLHVFGDTAWPDIRIDREARVVEISFTLRREVR